MRKRFGVWICWAVASMAGMDLLSHRVQGASFVQIDGLADSQVYEWNNAPGRWEPVHHQARMPESWNPLEQASVSSSVSVPGSSASGSVDIPSATISVSGHSLAYSHNPLPWVAGSSHSAGQFVERIEVLGPSGWADPIQGVLRGQASAALSIGGPYWYRDDDGNLHSQPSWGSVYLSSGAGIGGAYWNQIGGDSFSASTELSEYFEYNFLVSPAFPTFDVTLFTYAFSQYGGSYSSDFRLTELILPTGYSFISENGFLGSPRIGSVPEGGVLWPVWIAVLWGMCRFRGRDGDGMDGDGVLCFPFEVGR